MADEYRSVAAATYIQPQASQSQLRATALAQRERAVEAQAQSAAESRKMTEEEQKEVREAVKEINTALDSLNVTRQFEIEEELNQIVVKVIDTSEGKMIRQIPTEETLKYARSFREMVGVLFDETY